MQHYAWRKDSQVAMMPHDIFTTPGEEDWLTSLCAVYLGGGLATTPPPHTPLCYADIHIVSGWAFPLEHGALILYSVCTCNEHGALILYSVRTCNDLHKHMYAFCTTTIMLLYHVWQSNQYSLWLPWLLLQLFY